MNRKALYTPADFLICLLFLGSEFLHQSLLLQEPCEPPTMLASANRVKRYLMASENGVIRVGRGEEATAEICKTKR